MPAKPSISYLTLGQRHCHEPRRTAALHAHENAVLVVVAGGIDRLAHIAGIGDVLPGYFENDVAFLEAAFGRRALRVDLGDDDAVFAGAGDAIGGSNRHAELRHVGSLASAALVAVVGIGLGLDRVRQLAEREIDDLVLTLVQHVELHGVARRKPADGASEFAGILDRFTVDRSDDVAGFDAGLGRGAIGLRFGYQRAFRLLQAEAVGDVSRHRLDLDTDPAAADRALVLELGNHVLHRGSGNRERDADAAAGRRIDRGVDTHNLARGIERRATGLTLVHGRVDLDEVVIRAVTDVAAGSRDDAGRHRAAEAERVTNGEHPVADPRFGVGQLGEREIVAAGNLDQRDVGARIGADHLCSVGLAVVGRDFDLVGAVDDVIVGDGITVSRNEEAGALTRHRAAAATRSTAQARGQTIRTAEAPEETLHRRARLERRIVVLVGAVVLGSLLVDINLDRNHRRLHALDNVSKTDWLRDLAHFVVDLRVRRAREDIDRTRGRTEAVNGDAEASHNRGHQRKSARGKQRTARRAKRWKRGKIDGTFGHFWKSPDPESTVRGRAPDNAEDGVRRLTARWLG